MARLALRLLVLAGMLLLLPSAAAVTATPYDPFFATQATIADYTAGTRPLGVAAGDFDGDGKVDVVAGRVSGGAAAFTFQKGNGDGTFQAPGANFAWRVQVHNQWTLTSGDLDGDGKLDLVWGSTAATASSGCTISPIPSGQTCAGVGGQTVTVNPGEVRVIYGNGNGTFQENAYFASGVRFAAGQLLGRIGTTAAGSMAVADIDGDLDQDVVAGGIDGANSVVKILRNDGGGVFTMSTLISQATATSPGSPIYFPSTAAQDSPWGLAFGDADGDGDADLWVGDRALYVYLYTNNGSGSFTLTPGDTVVSPTRPNVYLAHETYRGAVGYSSALASGDVNGDGKADVVLGLQSGGQTPATGVAHDGEILLDVSTAGGHKLFGVLADVGTKARGVRLVDANGDGALDVIAGEYDGKVKLLRQLTPKDTDADGISDYVDNAPAIANAGRLDLNADGAVTHRDQLDNDFDTVLGNPEDESTWQRLGDPADPDDDNDSVADGVDNCPFVANMGQANADADAFGDACDPLDNRDADADGVPTGPLAGDAGYALAQAAAAKWSTGTTHFVIRIDALGRWFQNEFTQLMTDAATLSPADWALKCGENYQPEAEASDPPDPCGDPVTLAGGKEVPISIVTIPKQLWTDPPVVAWINDRNGSERFDLGQHMTYHAGNTMLGDWAGLPDRNFYSCEMCGFSEAEMFELGKVGYDTLLGSYGNKWVAESGATAGSPKIDWSTSYYPLLSFAPPFNASDTVARKAVAQLGFKAFSASVFEEEGATLGPIFTPEGSHHEQFDQFGMFHVSADIQLNPPATSSGTYDTAAYADYLQSQVDEGGLTTWLIEEVDWSGRPCNDADRLGSCPGFPNNRENNTVYSARWDAWMQLLDFVKAYPGGVALTMAEVALAKGYDNAPTVPNAGQADADHDGIGDAIDGAAFTAPGAVVSRNVAGTLAATLKNGAGAPIAGQAVTFRFDAAGDGTTEAYAATTDASGVASVSVTATRPVGTATYEVSWDGLRATASGTGNVDVADATTTTLDADNPTSGQVTDTVTVGATLRDSDGAGLEGRTLAFHIGSATGTGTTDANGHATATLTLAGPAGASTVEVSFAGAGAYGPSSATAAFTIEKEATSLTLTDAVAVKNAEAVTTATLTEADGAPVAGRTLTFLVQEKVKGKVVWTIVGTAVTGADGKATFTVPTRYVSHSMRPIRATFAGDGSFEGSSADASAYR